MSAAFAYTPLPNNQYLIHYCKAFEDVMSMKDTI